MTYNDQQASEPLVEIASDESVLRALAQSAHPVEFIEATADVPVQAAQAVDDGRAAVA